jgi:multidrug resistance efflux pump
MELLILLAYTAVCIAVFALLQIPLNRVTVPAATIGGLILSFALIQLLNYYHPYTDSSRQYLVATPAAPAEGGEPLEVPLMIEEPNLVAWFEQNSRFRLADGGAAEVTFDSIPGKVFAARVRGMLPAPGEYRSAENLFASPAAESQPRIPVLIDITDPRFKIYSMHLPGGSHAQAAVYGENLAELAVVRKTLLRMSAWLNYLTPIT